MTAPPPPPAPAALAFLRDADNQASGLASRYPAFLTKRWFTRQNAGNLRAHLRALIKRCLAEQAPPRPLLETPMVAGAEGGQGGGMVGSAAALAADGVAAGIEEDGRAGLLLRAAQEYEGLPARDRCALGIGGRGLGARA